MQKLRGHALRWMASANANAELTAARAALWQIKAPASPSPLADRLGVPACALDLVATALGSIAANGLRAA